MLQVKPVHTKRFGQHFLHDKYYINRIVKEAALHSSDRVIEIGPGGGALTENLLPFVKQLIAIEIDAVLCEHLRTRFSSFNHFTLHQGDALRMNCASLGITSLEKMRLLGNLPYNIAIPLLFHWLADRFRIRDFHVMVQKEVAERLVAVPGSKAYSRVSVMMQYYAKVTALFDVPPGAFSPPPQVESTVLNITPWQSAPFLAEDEVLFARIVKGAFNQKRKIIKNSLSAIGIGCEKLLAAHLNLQARPQVLRVEDYVRLANMCLKQS